MPSARLSLREEDVVRLMLEFLNNRELNITQLSLERETGVINGLYSDDVLFLRQLILDGQWDDVLEFIQPLEALQAFDMKHFQYTILRYKYIELLCIKSEAGGGTVALMGSMDGAVEEVVQVLAQLEKLAPSKDEYSGLCMLLQLPRLGDHMLYRDWNPSKARIQCFREVYPLVDRFLPSEKKGVQNLAAKNDRLVQLVIKGVLYESCVNYCQAKATGTTDGSGGHEMTFSKLLDGSVGFNDSDLSLLSWLQSIPMETFSVPFEQRTLNVDVERLERPSLETSWTEHMLITPIKPKTFPHSVMPFTRPRSAADIMTRSLLPTLDGSGGAFGGANGNPDAGQMSRSSFASFHLTGIKPSSGKLMTSSVDRLFENDGEVFLSSNYNDFQGLPSIQEATSAQSKSPEPGKLTEESTAGRDSPNTATSTAKSSRRDSLSEKIVNHDLHALPNQPQHPTASVAHPARGVTPPHVTEVIKKTLPESTAAQGGGELFEKFQRQKLSKEQSGVNNNGDSVAGRRHGLWLLLDRLIKVKIAMCCYFPIISLSR
uniref:CTLH domain-containing protein n=1 Tax=Phlebotomus kandelakii TaxID=1109342 RepID=A0A6B2E6Y3_9DIPT